MLEVFTMNLTLNISIMNNSFKTINPFNDEIIKKYETHTIKQLSDILKHSENTFQKWRDVSIKERCRLLNNLAEILDDDKHDLAKLISIEMGKPITQSIAEIEKCITLCDFYAVNAEDILADQLIETDASESFISYDPLGVILA